MNPLSSYIARETEQRLIDLSIRSIKSLHSIRSNITKTRRQLSDTYYDLEMERPTNIAILEAAKVEFTKLNDVGREQFASHLDMYTRCNPIQQLEGLQHGYRVAERQLEDISRSFTDVYGLTQEELQNVFEMTSRSLGFPVDVFFRLNRGGYECKLVESISLEEAKTLYDHRVDETIWDSLEFVKEFLRKRRETLEALADFYDEAWTWLDGNCTACLIALDIFQKAKNGVKRAEVALEVVYEEVAQYRDTTAAIGGLVRELQEREL